MSYDRNVYSKCKVLLSAEKKRLYHKQLSTDIWQAILNKINERFGKIVENIFVPLTQVELKILYSRVS